MNSKLELARREEGREKDREEEEKGPRQKLEKDPRRTGPHVCTACVSGPIT